MSLACSDRVLLLARIGDCPAYVYILGLLRLSLPVEHGSVVGKASGVFGGSTYRALANTLGHLTKRTDSKPG